MLFWYNMKGYDALKWNTITYEIWCDRICFDTKKNNMIWYATATASYQTVNPASFPSSKTLQASAQCSPFPGFYPDATWSIDPAAPHDPNQTSKWCVLAGKLISGAIVKACYHIPLIRMVIQWLSFRFMIAMRGNPIIVPSVIHKNQPLL